MTLDFLGNLPNSIIDVILMCLPCKDVLRTSILSKNWRYRWCKLTELTVDEGDFKDTAVIFESIINQILTFHEGLITKFTLDIGINKKDKVISFISKNEIHHLVLHLPNEKQYKLPSSVFTCSQLRQLTVHDCIIHLPSTFEAFDRLISLELFSIKSSSKSLESLISHCPLLERLVLKDANCSKNRIEINAPMLTYFRFRGYIDSIYLKNVPRLAKVFLDCCRMHLTLEKFDIANFFEHCSAVEHLVLDFPYNFLSEGADKPPTRLPFDLACVKRFYVPLFLNESYGLSSALCLIRSFPYLEYLEIEAYFEWRANEDGRCMLESLKLERFSDVTFNHLKEVKIRHVFRATRELQIIKLFLAKSPVLVRMLLVRPYEKRLDAEISKFWRESPNAVVVYQKEE